jgi:hypothetical protein
MLKREISMKVIRLPLLLLLPLLSAGFLLPSTAAQDWLPQQTWVPSEEFAEFEDEDLPVEPGQLGRHYLELQYLQVETLSQDVDLTDPLKGFSFIFNVPSRWNDRLPEFMGQDVFLATLGLQGSGADPGGLASVDLELRSFSSGLTTYLFVTENFRPFVQLGVTTQMFQADLNFLGATLPFGDLDTKLMANPGFELDLGERVAWRNLLESETKESFKDSGFRSELVFWPGSRWFLKGGIAGDLRGESWGFLLGGGYSW